MSDKSIESNYDSSLGIISITNFLKYYIYFQLSMFAVFVALQYFMTNKNIEYNILQYLYPLSMISIPLYMTKIKGISLKTLGLQRGKYSIFFSLILGLTVALLYLILVRFSPFWKEPHLYKVDNINKYVYSLVYLFTVTGFAESILTPICEEIFYRGFIFGVIREKISEPTGLVLQSFIFSLAHVSWSHFNPTETLLVFASGLILGLLYEHTKSLYPGMICHGFINYFSFLSRFINF